MGGIRMGGTFTATGDEHDSGGETDTPMPDLKIHAKTRRAGGFVVLSSGRLLLSDVRGTTEAEIDFGSGNTMKQRHDLHATLRMIEACDGPVLGEPDPK